MLNKFELRFADFLQDEGIVKLGECETRFQKSQSTLKRSIYRMNDYLPPEQHFVIKNNQVMSQINRADYEELCERLELREYATGLGERILLILFTGFFEEKVNLTQLYEDLGLSQTTRKKDSRKLKAYLKDMHLNVENHYNKGIAITGTEESYRNYIALKLSNIIELDREDDLTARKANTPVQKQVYQSYIDEIKRWYRKTKMSIQESLEQKHLSVDYASKKFLYIYYTIARMRMKKGHIVKKDTLKIETPHFHLFENKEESRYMDYVMASLNYKEPLQFPIDDKIKKIVNLLIDTVEIHFEMIIYTKVDLFESLYAYMYKCQILNKLGYSFYDHKLEQTYVELEDLYEMIEEAMEKAQECTIQLTQEQVSVVSLIIETYLLKNQLAGTGKKKLVIITNSSAEKVDYFEEKLKQFVEFEIVEYATLNELHKLDTIEYDDIIVFSSRIQTVLRDLGYTSLRIPFYLKFEDVKRLIEAGFTSNQNAKLIAREVIEELDGKSQNEKVEYLKGTYGDYFL